MTAGTVEPAEVPPPVGQHILLTFVGIPQREAALLRPGDQLASQNDAPTQGTRGSPGGDRRRVTLVSKGRAQGEDCPFPPAPHGDFPPLRLPAERRRGACRLRPCAPGDPSLRPQIPGR